MTQINDARKIIVDIKKPLNKLIRRRKIYKKCCLPASSVTNNLLKSFSLSSNHVSKSPFTIRIISRIINTKQVTSMPKFSLVAPAIDETAKNMIKMFKAPVISKSLHVRSSIDLKITKEVKNSSRIVKQLNVMIPKTRNCFNEPISMTNY